MDMVGFGEEMFQVNWPPRSMQIPIHTNTDPYKYRSIQIPIHTNTDLSATFYTCTWIPTTRYNGGGVMAMSPQLPPDTASMSIKELHLGSFALDGEMLNTTLC
jgi:hypothetical protein